MVPQLNLKMHTDKEYKIDSYDVYLKLIKDYKLKKINTIRLPHNIKNVLRLDIL